MAVHLYGQVCNIEPLLDLCKTEIYFLLKTVLRLLEVPLRKNVLVLLVMSRLLVFLGIKLYLLESGMILFQKREILNKAKILRDHGMSPSKRYWHDEIGFNYRLTNMQAAIGVAQLERFDSILEKKLEIAKLYKKYLQGEDNILMLPNEYSNVVHSNWLFTIILNNKIKRDLLIDELNNLGIETRPVFYSLNIMPPYINCKTSDTLLNSSQLSTNGLSLPTSLSLLKEDIIYVCNSLKSLITLKNDQK